MEALAEPAHNPIGNFRFVALGYDGETALHLISPVDESSPIHRLMQDRVNPLNPHGEGIYQLVCEVPDPEAFAQQVEAGGGRVTRVPNSESDLGAPVVVQLRADGAAARGLASGTRPRGYPRGHLGAGIPRGHAVRWRQYSRPAYRR